jgi:glycosyltransferase involved in cell wall biosynthesis
LVLSNGPVPYDEHVVVEGGGLRCWGLARGLAAAGLEVTVAVDAAHGDVERRVGGIRVTAFRRDEALIRLMSNMDAVVVSYCMGSTTEYVINHVPAGTLLIGDAYVPIHVEVSARDAVDVEREESEFQADLPRWNAALQRSDLLLVASPQQRLYYTGLLAALGRITPSTYRDDRILEVPFGIHQDETPPAAHPHSANGMHALWFGGVYPWFDASALVDSIRLVRDRGIPFELTLAGARNPFVQHEDFIQHADDALSSAQAAPHVHVVDWVPYRERRRVYEGHDFIISLNKTGPENQFSWRTRLVDYVWSGLPVLTNGGDPLAERLIAAGAAMRLAAATPEAIADAVDLLWREPERLATMRAAMADARLQLDWRLAIRPLVEALEAGITPVDVIQPSLPAGSHAAGGQAPATVLQARMAAVKTYSVRARRYARTHGVPATARVASRVLLSKVPKPTPSARKPHFYVISHQLDMSGAPKVALDVAGDARRALGPGRVTLIGFPPVATTRLAEARRSGIAPQVLQRGMPLPLIRPHDDVLLSSLAVPHDVVNDVLWRLEHGRLRSLQWFVHEDQPQRWWDPSVISRLAPLVEAGRLRVLVPSVQMQSRHAQHLWLDEGVELVPLRIDVTESLRGHRPPEDFQRIRFHLTGSAHDGRKGHAAALSAFQELVLTTDMTDRSRWRDFELHFFGLGDDFMSSELRHLGAAVLQDRFATHQSAPHDSALRLMSKANVVLCCAIYEAFGLYISESMAMGHVVLRNSAAGQEEQLIDGENGLWIGDQDQERFVSCLRRILDRTALSEAELAKWSTRSTELAQASLTVDYGALARWPERAGARSGH